MNRIGLLLVACIVHFVALAAIAVRPSQPSTTGAGSITRGGEMLEATLGPLRNATAGRKGSDCRWHAAQSGFL